MKTREKVKLTINGGDLQHSWTPKQFEDLVAYLTDLPDKLGIKPKEIMITGFKVE